MKKIDTTIKLWNLDIFSSNENQLLNFLKNHLEQGSELLTVATPNPEQVVLSKEKPEFLAALQGFDFLIPDGIGLIWAARLLAWKGKTARLSQRITGVSVVEQLCNWASTSQLPAVVVGGREYQRLERFCPTATWVEGYADILHPTPAEEKRVVAKITQIKPVIVFVALGAPYQELWITQHRAVLETADVRLAMAVGGSFDVLLKKIPRAPKIWQNLGLEWLYRLIQEPWRWRRQLKLLSFMKLTAREVLT